MSHGGPGPLDAAALRADGFATVDLFDDDTLARLRRLWAEQAVPDDSSYWTSLVHSSRPEARTIDQRLKAICRAAVGTLLPGHEVFLAAFILKGARGGAVELHPDWTYTDERHTRTTLLWAPLIDTDESNGTLWFVPGTHQAMTGLRGSGDFSSSTSQIEDELWADAVPVPVGAGGAIVYDAAVVHGSRPNRTDAPRPVVALAAASEGAELVHFHRAPNGRLSGYRIDESWYTTQPFGLPPEGYPSIEPWSEPQAPLTLGALRER